MVFLSEDSGILESKLSYYILVKIRAPNRIRNRAVFVVDFRFFGKPKIDFLETRFSVSIMVKNNALMVIEIAQILQKTRTFSPELHIWSMKMQEWPKKSHTAINRKKPKTDFENRRETENRLFHSVWSSRIFAVRRFQPKDIL
jgi:hypothetical protein